MLRLQNIYRNAVKHTWAKWAPALTVFDLRINAVSHTRVTRVTQNAAAAKALEQQSRAMDEQVSMFRLGDAPHQPWIHIRPELQQLEALLPLATVVTPNLPEAGVLLGERGPDNLKEMRRAAERLRTSAAAMSRTQAVADQFDKIAMANPHVKDVITFSGFDILSNAIISNSGMTLARSRSGMMSPSKTLAIWSCLARALPRTTGLTISRCDGLKASVRWHGPIGVETSDEKPM